MPGRKVPLITNHFYHILNKGIILQPVFDAEGDYLRAIETIRYYQNIQPPLRYAQFIVLSNERKKQILENLKKERKFLVEIIAYCLMPNHFHFLLKQAIEGGISKFVSNFSNSYTRYFNIKNKRTGHLFQGKFKAVRVKTVEQLLHLSRYIHLNPYSSYVVRTLKDLAKYPYSSFPEYLEKYQAGLCSKEIIFDQFKDLESHRRFVFDRADYQRMLEKIKLLTLESLE